MDKSEKIFVAGYRGLVGSALIRRLEREGFSNLPKRDRAQLDGELSWDTTKPDGMQRKLLDVARLHSLGWHPTIPLRDGIAQTYDWFLKKLDC